MCARLRSCTQCMQKMSRNGRIDFMKIDIEGYEKEIFTDEASWPVLCEMRCIAAELHDWFIPGCADALNKFLNVRGYELNCEFI